MTTKFSLSIYYGLRKNQKWIVFLMKLKHHELEWPYTEAELDEELEDELIDDYVDMLFMTLSMKSKPGIGPVFLNGYFYLLWAGGLGLVKNVDYEMTIFESEKLTDQSITGLLGH